MRKRRATETADETIERNTKNRKLMAEKRASEPESVKMVRRESNRIAMAGKRATESEATTIARRTSNRIAMAGKRATESEATTIARRTSNQIAMAGKRATESEATTIVRRTSNRIAMAGKRATESEATTIARRTSNRIAMAGKRATESEATTIARRTSNRIAMAGKRATESEATTIARRTSNRISMAGKRSSTSTFDDAIKNFHLRVKQGPNFTCISCHRLLYKQSVISFNAHKYTKCSRILQDILSFGYTGDKQWVCKACDGALTRGNIPVQAKANGFKLPVIPPELSCLNALEKRLISLRVPFMKMVALPSGKQRCIHGPAVNVPSKLDSVCELLPRLPSETELVPLKLKRKLSYKGHYLYDFVRPDKVIGALRWLKDNNPLYKDVAINDNWVQDSLANNSDLFTGLTEESMDTDDTHTDENMDTGTVVSQTSNGENAIDVLSSVASRNGFTIHNVPADGDCLFSAIAYQLPSIGISDIDACSLRIMLVSHLEDHPTVEGTHFRSFLSEPVPSTNAYNADTEAPTAEDEAIAAVDDSDTRAQLMWLQYLERLRHGAWGDNIAIQGICEMLNITINIISTHNPNMLSIAPSSSTSTSRGNVYVGLFEQFHYVGLDKVCSSNSECDNFEEVLDDTTIEEGDAHTREITCCPQESMLSVENPESDAQTYSIAPAEGQKPISIMTDEKFEEMANPDKLCFGTGGFTTERPRKITYRKYFNQRLLDVDGRFARDMDYLFVAQYIVEAKQILDDRNNFIWRQKPGCQPLTVSQVRSQQSLNEFIQKDKAYRFMKNVRGSPPYYQRTFYDLLAMIRQLGTPTWFLTLSAADMKWPDVIQTIAKQYGTIYTDDEVASLSFEEKSNWLRCNPVTAARHFQYRLNTFFNDFLKSTAKPLGEIVDHAIRIEFQARGSPHAHTVIWVKDAPRFGINNDSDVINFIDKYITCTKPEDGKLRELVLLLQEHKHSSYCKRGKTCRFHFPQPPSPVTLIAKSDFDENQLKAAKETLAKVRKVLIDGNNSDVTLEELLGAADVELEEYMTALQMSSKGNNVLLKRNPDECKINNYNSAVMLAWQANMDIQYVLNAYACVMYVASYIMKTERSMGDLLKRVACESRTDELTTQLRKVGNAFLTHREVSAQEAAYRILSIPMKQLSRSVVFVDTNPKNERIAVLKNSQALEQLEDNDVDVFQKSLIDRYQHRPQIIQSLCLAEFAATYVTNYQKEDDSDALPPVESETTSSHITLTGGFGKMNKRKREAVIRFRRYNKDAEPSNWYRAKLMLYFPWYNEDTDLLGGYTTYEEHYRHVHAIVVANESKYSQTDIEDIEVDEDGPPEHVWADIAPNTEEGRSRALEEGEEQLTEVAPEDLQDHANVFDLSVSHGLRARFESAANKEEIPAEEYRRLLRGLNEKQRGIVMYHRNWCKKTVIALKNGEPIVPYKVFLSGPGGVGKSHVIRLIHSDTLKLLRLAGTLQPGDVTVLLTAPTGVAAFNINGMTLHSALLLGCSKYAGFQPLSHDRLNTLRSKLSKLMLVIIDEVSMVGCNMLLEIHKRLQQIKGVLPDVMFGGVSILAVGDLYQLPPVGQPALFDTVTDAYARLHGSGSLWKDEFEMIELDEIMRQRGDSAFTELLCRVRLGECTPGDLDILKSRVIAPDSPDYPHNVLHVYRLNTDVDSRNSFMLNSLAPEDQQYVIEASDAVAGQTRHIDLSRLSNKRSETGGLHGVLKLAIGARVMLTTNVDVADGLVNGARGEVVHVVSNDGKVVKVLVKFDHPDVGLKAVQSSPYRSTFPHAVPIGKHEVKFPAQGRRGAEVTRLQFPLTLSWATTIHKVQGLTLDAIVVDMKGGRFSPGQAYVAFSRVKTLQGLHICNFSPTAIKKSNKVHEEMARLNTKLVKFVSDLESLPVPSNYITLSLLNVRSIVAKMHDIECDTCINAVDIMCFCETWLSPSQPSPHIKDGHIVLRCDRVYGNSKGGVLMSVPSTMQPSHTSTFTSHGIEGLSTRLLIHNTECIQIALLYRPPSVPAANFVTVLNTLLVHMSLSNLPTIILGDFNENLYDNTHSRILDTMTSSGYTQLVQSPTTDRGTLIDHVYYNRPSDNAVVQVHDTYYSDHDTVYCSIVQF